MCRGRVIDRLIGEVAPVVRHLRSLLWVWKPRDLHSTVFRVVSLRAGLLLFSRWHDLSLWGICTVHELHVSRPTWRSSQLASMSRIWLDEVFEGAGVVRHVVSLNHHAVVIVAIDLHWIVIHDDIIIFLLLSMTISIARSLTWGRSVINISWSLDTPHSFLWNRSDYNIISLTGLASLRFLGLWSRWLSATHFRYGLPLSLISVIVCCNFFWNNAFVQRRLYVFYLLVSRLRHLKSLVLSLLVRFIRL